MKAYISLSYSQRKSLEPVVQAICDTLRQQGIEPFVFVDHYHFTKEEENTMMQQALADINTCDLLIAETSDKAIGIGVEAGYARAKEKPVLYLRHHTAEHSTTVAGISHYHLVYLNEIDLKQQLAETLQKVLSSLSTSIRL